MPKTVSTSIGMIVILSLLLGACAPAAAPTPAPGVAFTPTAPAGLAPTPLPATPEPQLSEKPRYGGILRIPQKYETPTFDLHQASTIGALHPIAPMYNMLVQQDTQDYTKIVPDLAEKWEVTPDGLTWTLYLA
ncbi:MAG: hypothetical protein Q8O76_12810 [Chloroflexota bacterium]|nr:hypothetical protein [Chloroflexota bacterium]